MIFCFLPSLPHLVLITAYFEELLSKSVLGDVDRIMQAFSCRNAHTHPWSWSDWLKLITSLFPLSSQFLSIRVFSVLVNHSVNKTSTLCVFVLGNKYSSGWIGVCVFMAACVRVHVYVCLCVLDKGFSLHLEGLDLAAKESLFLNRAYVNVGLWKMITALLWKSRAARAEKRRVWKNKGFAVLNRGEINSHQTYQMINTQQALLPHCPRLQVELQTR
jgi:hypothetical protein